MDETSKEHDHTADQENVLQAVSEVAHNQKPGYVFVLVGDRLVTYAFQMPVSALIGELEVQKIVLARNALAQREAER